MRSKFYFTQDSEGTKLRNALADAFELDGLPNPYPEDTDIAAGLEANGDWTTRDWEESPSWVDHIYHTNYYKFATSSSGTVPNWADDVWFVSCMLSWELEMVNPDVVFSFGKETWEYYFRQRVEWHPQMESDEPLPSVETLGVAQATGCHFINPDTGRTVLVSQHPRNGPNFTDSTAGKDLPASE